MKLLIFEDEIPAYDKLLSLVKEEIPEVEMLGWARSVEEAKTLVMDNPEVDLIFSDIQLLDGNSFEIYADIDISCPIIFCTAYEKFVFEAFKNNGIAYLLKPYDKEAFIEALLKYKKFFVKDKSSFISKDVINDLRSIMDGGGKSYKKRWVVKKSDGIKLLSTNDIVYFKANGDFTMAFDKDHKHAISDSIGSIESKLNPSSFFRINRGEILNINYILKIEPYFKNRLAIKVVGQNEPLYTSNSRTPEFRLWLDH